MERGSFDGTGQSWMGFREEGPCHPSCECGGEHPVQTSTQMMRLEHLETMNWLDIKEQQLMKDNKKQDKQTKAIIFDQTPHLCSRFLCLVVVDLRSNLTCNRSGDISRRHIHSCVAPPAELARWGPRACQPRMARLRPGSKQRRHCPVDVDGSEIRGSTHHVEGRVLPLFTRFCSSQVVVWDFLHQQYQEMGCSKIYWICWIYWIKMPIISRLLERKRLGEDSSR